MAVQLAVADDEGDSAASDSVGLQSAAPSPQP